MSSIGQTLRDARLLTGLTLDQISADTRISVKNLRAIEEDDLNQIASKFFYTSFVRQLAARVGLSESALEENLRVTAARLPEPFQPGQMRVLLKRTLVSRQRSVWQWKTPVALTSFAAVMAVCSFFYSVWADGYGHRTWSIRVHHALALTGSQVRDAGSHRVPVPIPSGESPKETSQAVQPTVTQKDPSATQGPPNGFRAELAAIERSWLSIEADGQRVFSGVLEPNETKVVEGDTARVRTGNAGGLKVVFNGQEMGVVGPRGQIRVVVFHRDAYVVLPSANASARIAKPLPDVKDWFMARVSQLRLNSTE